MTSISTPLDAFMSDVLVWIESAWYLWVALGIVVAVVIASVVVAKVRRRGYERVPHYFRGER